VSEVIVVIAGAHGALAAALGDEGVVHAGVGGPGSCPRERQGRRGSGCSSRHQSWVREGAGQGCSLGRGVVFGQPPWWWRGHLPSRCLAPGTPHTPPPRPYLLSGLPVVFRPSLFLVGAWPLPFFLNHTSSGRGRIGLEVGDYRRLSTPRQLRPCCEHVAAPAISSKKS